MEYNFEMIGKRIRKERKLLGYSQHAILDVLREKGYVIGYNKYSQIETGKYYNYDFNFLCVLSELFNCEIGYILCEHDCKTGRNTDIQNELGLSEESIELIKIWKSSGENISFLNELLQMSQFELLIERLHAYKHSLSQDWSFDESLVKINNDKAISAYYANDSLSLLLEEMRKRYKGKHVNPHKH
ncbi:helix-turn-helix domain-containing protein [Butyrivibrio sp. AD3002]|uniref:helix-turn-helix domain-containing protein n=1 Tax=Butyrivibrio sp. AD3002 TaxID=1280670 RepID=UPI0012DCEC0D|nr:helix-turn-helix domain-containing protein [Butyrivibrio sp. AD3002]